jgi:gliding motility-associated-like protein
MSLCTGGTIRLFADTIVSSAYSWKGPNGFTSNLQNPFINNASTINSGDYILNVTVPGCGSYYDTVNITVSPRSLTSINQSICQGQTYFGHSSGGTYIDTFISVNGCDSVRTVNLTVKPKSFSIINQSICQGRQYLGHSTTGIFIDTLIAANGCDSIRTLNLGVNPSPVTNINQTICTGQTYLGYDISGVFKDTFATASGCDSMRTLNLTVNDLPKPDLGPDAFLCSSDTLSISPGKFLSYVWQDGSSLDQYTVRKPGFYSVTVTNNCGSAADNILVSDKSCNVYFPSVFTPNKDGKNEVFKILNATNLQDFYMALYNRWGQKIFETRDYTKGWDGTVGGEPVEIGAYVWNCEFKKSSIPNRFRGTVILVR